MDGDCSVRGGALALRGSFPSAESRPGFEVDSAVRVLFFPLGNATLNAASVTYGSLSIAEREAMTNVTKIGECAAGPQPNMAAFAYYRRLERLKRHVETHLSESVSLADAARVAGLERKYFSTFFRGKVGVTFTSWLSSVRLDAAEQLLSTRNHAISSVADQVGFGDLRTFERAFKRAHGSTPSQFKNSARPC